jgi:ribonuclease J
MKLSIHRDEAKIGGSLVEVATKNTKIILDRGLNMPPLHLKDNSRIPGSDFDIFGLTTGPKSYGGFIITNYHSDFWWNLSRVIPGIPLFASLEKEKAISILSEYYDYKLPEISCLDPLKELIIGDLKVVSFPVKSGAEGTDSYLIEGDGKKILFAGGAVEIDQNFRELFGKIDVLLCDGANIGSAGEKDEKELEARATEIMREARGKVLVVCAATNFDRIKSFFNASIALRRKLAIDPLMNKLAKIFFPSLSKKDAEYIPKDISCFLSDMELNYSVNYEKVMSGPDYSVVETAAKVMKDTTFFPRVSSGANFLESLDQLTSLDNSAVIYSKRKGCSYYGDDKEFLGLCAARNLKIDFLDVRGEGYMNFIKTLSEEAIPKVLIPTHTQNPLIFESLYDNVLTLNGQETYEF